MNAQEALSRLTDIALTREWGAEEEIIRCNEIVKKALDQYDLSLQWEGYWQS